MGHANTDQRERGAWAPFVGVALALLTAGSLAVFSLVAQRTSLDGFSARGATALAPSQDAPGSITLPGGATDAPDATATTLLTLPPSVLDGLDAGSVVVADAPPASDADVQVAARPNGDPASKDVPVARFDDGGLSPRLFRDGEVRAAAQDGDGDAVEAKKADKPKKAKKGGKEKNKPAPQKGRGHGRSARGNKVDDRGQRGGRHGHGRQDSSHRSNGSNDAAASQPRRSSRPAPAPQPQRAAKSKSKAGHANTTGKGHSKGRGRGHAHD